MIPQVLKIFNKPIATTLMISMLLGLWLIPIAVLADDKTPPDDKAPPTGRSSGGRGCGTTTQPAQSNVSALILLAPRGYSRQTVSTRPTFAWFVRDAASVAMEFRLYEQENNRFKLVKEIKDESFKTSPGIMVLSPSDSTPELTVGKRYRWQVELVCDPSRPSGNLFAQSEIEVVPIPADLKKQLERTGVGVASQKENRLNQAKLYAQANLWYDALGKAFASLSDEIGLKDFRLSLLDKVAANDTERQVLQGSEIHALQR
ncbi:hypothetical protein SAMD00079811_78760 (plasmid) [Scytonema sp. HK-05]|uniref:DUF928 domain-containing protein n=1 Tax=Scytonema sp. HK-05 TaxID=1137095 RepID=UPI000936699E|nr:DUF928 domain-containing protein [Scytonema sp. HK-05]OKH57062.1 hypothetical protein NIES2130_21725 [Scytonema sp. HK-05]BAY50247.1 hypothetical protein SAMD00079811_78760 [Scytonema sp. HK-05]